MGSFDARTMLALIKRELIENKYLFLSAPLVVSVLALVATLWSMSLFNSLGAETLDTYSSDVGSLLFPTAFIGLMLPFGVVFAAVSVIYLINTLYQDRKDLSHLFWQSMPVSNSETVVSKLITIVVVAPAIVCLLFLLLEYALLVVLGIASSLTDLQLDIKASHILDVSSYALNFYLLLLANALKFFPTIGWLLLFSAFAKSVPALWAIGAYILLNILEDVFFSTQFLTNWSDSRLEWSNYTIFGFADFVDSVFIYDTFIGVCFGGILIAGAIAMRRFAD